MTENLPKVATPLHPATVGGSLFLDVARFEHAQRVARMLVTSTMIPEHFQNNIGNCLIALNLAERFMADPFMVMQNVYIVHGKPGVEGKLIIALVNQCGKFSPLQFRFDRNGSDVATACTAFATHKETEEVLEQKVTWAMVQAEGWDRKKGSKWLTMPELMFQYRSATFFARVYCPEVILGMQTTEEIFDFVDMTKQDGTYAVEGAPQDLTEKLKEAKKDTKKPEIVGPGEAGEAAGTEGEGNTDYFQSNFAGLKSTFEGKLRNHIKTDKIVDATEADLEKLREKWRTNQDTKDKLFPLDEPPEQTEQQDTGDHPPLVAGEDTPDVAAWLAVDDNIVGLIGCPEMDGKNNVRKLCRACEKAAKCEPLIAMVMMD